MAKRVKVLHIEDNPGDARLFKEMLKEDNAYNLGIEWVSTLEDGISRLTDGGIDVVLLDLTLPGTTGYETFRSIRDCVPDTAIVLYTGLNDEALAIEVTRAGAQDYLIKGETDARMLTRSIRYAVERKHLVEELRSSLKGTIYTISKIVETKDPYTSGHQLRVAELAQAIASIMGVDKDIIEGIQMAAVVHDIGKISIPHEILSKPGKLTELEFKIIKTHSEVGYNILNDIDFPWPIADIVIQHHEKLDGSGYPLGLKTEDILFEAKVICVADVVEAMSSHRPYRPKLGIEEALNEVMSKKGMLYDEGVVLACEELISGDGFDFEYSDYNFH